MDAGKWYPQYTETLRGRYVVLLPDNDQAGRGHIAKIAEELLGADCTVRVVELSGLPDKGDVSDWLDAGHTVEHLKALAEATEPMAAQPKAKNLAPFRLQVEDSDPPVWLVHWPRGIVRVQSADLHIWSRTRDAHLAELKAGPGWAPASTREWNEHVADLLDQMEQDPEGHVAVPPAGRGTVASPCCCRRWLDTFTPCRVPCGSTETLGGSTATPRTRTTSVASTRSA
jgi:hypothetical protein